MAGIAAATHRYRGREITAADILYIEELIGAHPGASRRTLSKKLCEAWEWRQPNGALRDMVCRGMLLMLDRAGQIALPPVSYLRHNPLAKRARPAPMALDTTPINRSLREPPAAGVSTGAAHLRRAAVQRPDGRTPLPGLRTAGGFCDILLYLTNFLKTLTAG